MRALRDDLGLNAAAELIKYDCTLTAIDCAWVYGELNDTLWNQRSAKCGCGVRRFLIVPMSRGGDTAAKHQKESSRDICRFTIPVYKHELTIEPTTPKPSATLANLLAMTKAMEVNQVCGTKEATHEPGVFECSLGWTPRRSLFQTHRAHVSPSAPFAANNCALTPPSPSPRFSTVNNGTIGICSCLDAFARAPCSCLVIF